MKRWSVLGLVVGIGVLLVLTGRVRAQLPQQNVAGIEKIKPDLYMITGGGGNTAAFVTSKGVVVIDTKVQGWGQPILEKIRTITDKPVTMIINTHTHGDHVGSNSEFPGTVEVVAHENCKASMEKMPLFQAEDRKKYLPARTFGDRLTLLSGAERMELLYFGRGHTGGDTVVVFPALRTAHMGDLFAWKGTPIMDVNNGGSGVAYPKTLAGAVAGLKDVETLIPGHMGVTDMNALREFTEFNQAFLDAVATAYKEGKTIDDAAASLKLPEKFKDYNMSRSKANVAVIYSELNVK
jgi:cyclase